MPNSNDCKVIAVVPDLFFAAKIGETARQLGVAVAFAASEQAVLEKVSLGPSLVIVDLGAASVGPVQLITRLKTDPAWRSARIVGFVNHERSDLIEQARAAHCDEVLTRGAFVKSLPAMLTATGSSASGKQSIAAD
jgi:CheY-like chemotaxis protein